MAAIGEQAKDPDMDVPIGFSGQTPFGIKEPIPN